MTKKQLHPSIVQLDIENHWDYSNLNIGSKSNPIFFGQTCDVKLENGDTFTIRRQRDTTTSVNRIAEFMSNDYALSNQLAALESETARLTKELASANEELEKLRPKTECDPSLDDPEF
jgi:hypothetical protein